MKCINCKSANTAVVDTYGKGCARRRRYKCRDCGSRFNTLEGYESDALFNDGTWANQAHLEMVAKQLAEGSAELAALAKLLDGRSDRGKL